MVLTKKKGSDDAFWRAVYCSTAQGCDKNGIQLSDLSGCALGTPVEPLVNNTYASEMNQTESNVIDDIM